jgi:choline dehydrogenase-like flavoprotein
MLVDARSVPHGSQFSCDLCIVGAGPAGITIADRLRDSGLGVILLESGGFDNELSTQRLYRGENVGRSYYRLDACRWRLFGGSSNRWGGMSRPLDPQDFERRDWLPWSGWPISWETVDAYRVETAKILGLPNARFDVEGWRNVVPSPFNLDGTHFENILFSFSSPEINFGESYREQVLGASNVTTFLHANLTDMRLQSDSQCIETLQVSVLPGKVFTVRPRAVVLATGGIENARLLLASRKDRESGLGNEHDFVGRFFMEHLHVRAGHMVAASDSSRDFYRKTKYGRAVVRGAMAPTAVAQEQLQRVTTSIGIEPAGFTYGTPFCGWPPPVTFGPIRLYRRLRGGRYHAVVETLKVNAERMIRASRRMRTWRDARTAVRRDGRLINAEQVYSLYFRSEQVPDPASRVTLSERSDALGMPQSRLDWRVNQVDLDAISSWLRLLDSDLRSQGIGQVVGPLEGWEDSIIGGPHHMGTTRMSLDPRHGVADEHCRVHSVDNLYIAGSSLFPTCGHANPTFAIVSLALRLADTLRERIGQTTLVSQAP